MNEPEPHNPSPEIAQEDPNLQSVTKRDMQAVNDKIASIEALLVRIAAAVEAPGSAEAARKKVQEENAAANVKSGFISG
jgi:hypothetical protein